MPKIENAMIDSLHWRCFAYRDKSSFEVKAIFMDTIKGSRVTIMQLIDNENDQVQIPGCSCARCMVRALVQCGTGSVLYLWVLHM